MCLQPLWEVLIPLKVQHPHATRSLVLQEGVWDQETFLGEQTHWQDRQPNKGRSEDLRLRNWEQERQRQDQPVLAANGGREQKAAICRHRALQCSAGLASWVLLLLTLTYLGFIPISGSC